MAATDAIIIVKSSTFVCMVFPSLQPAIPA
jgi:hypothetical protein